MALDPRTARRLVERLDLEQLAELRAVAAGGPGGQHANRNATTVVVTLALDTLDPELAAHLGERLPPVVTVRAGDTRSQAQNRRLALERLRTRLLVACDRDAVRRRTNVPAAERARRREAKARRSARLAGRRSRDD